MPFETRCLTENLETDIAGEGLFLGVRSPMDDEISFAWEIPTALIALKGT